MKIFRLLSVACLGGVGLALSGCASIITQNDQEIAVDTPMVDQANCSLSNARGNWTVTTPGRIEVIKSKTDLLVRCTKPGVPDGEVTAGSGFEPWTLGNILLGGLIGLGVDWATGSIHKYPSTISVPMGTAPAASTPASGSTTASSTAPTS